MFRFLEKLWDDFTWVVLLTAVRVTIARRFPKEASSETLDLARPGLYQVRDGLDKLLTIGRIRRGWLGWYARYIRGLVQEKLERATLFRPQ